MFFLFQQWLLKNCFVRGDQSLIWCTLFLECWGRCTRYSIIQRQTSSTFIQYLPGISFWGTACRSRTQPFLLHLNGFFLCKFLWLLLELLEALASVGSCGNESPVVCGIRKTSPFVSSPFSHMWGNFQYLYLKKKRYLFYCIFFKIFFPVYCAHKSCTAVCVLGWWLKYFITLILMLLWDIRSVSKEKEESVLCAIKC